MALHYLSSSLKRLFHSPPDNEFLESQDADKIKRKLTSRGYNINQDLTCKFHDYEKIRAVHYVFARGFPTGCQSVLDNGGSVDDQTDSGLYPFHFSVIYKKVDNIEVLMNNSGDANVQDAKGDTPLHYAVGAKNLGVVKRLVKDHGADVHVKNWKGISPLDLAETFVNKAIFNSMTEIICEKESLNKLISKQEVLSKKVKKINSKMKHMKDEIKQQVTQEVKQEMGEEFDRIKGSLVGANPRYRGGYYPDSGYNTPRSLSGTGSLQGNVPSLINQFETLSKSNMALQTVAEVHVVEKVTVSPGQVGVFVEPSQSSESDEGERSSIDSDDCNEMPQEEREEPEGLSKYYKSLCFQILGKQKLKCLGVWSFKLIY